MSSVDTSKLEAALKAINFGAGDLLTIEKTGAAVQINGQRMRVAVDTSATKNSIGQHIVEATEKKVVDDIGPETIYAPNIEFGVQSKPNYPVQPFVRPTAYEDMPETVNAMGKSFGAMVIQRWPK